MVMNSFAPLAENLKRYCGDCFKFTKSYGYHQNYDIKHDKHMERQMSSAKRLVKRQ